jgi:heme a synthase
MSTPRISPALYRRITAAAVVTLAAIVVTGGAVRLTASGLGCPTWPRCTATSYTSELAFHPMVEFVNRLITVAVFGVVLACVVGAWLQRPHRRDLMVLSLGLVAGFVAQAVLGGLTVLFHLSPVLVMGHFLLSMALLWDAVLLHHRAGGPDTRAYRVVRQEVVWLSRLLTVTAGLVLVAGTVVTGTGPNSGASVVTRLPFELRDVAQLHADIVMFAVGLAVALAVVLQVARGPKPAVRRSRQLLAVMLAQIAVGFAQYGLGLAHARALVLMHMLGATLFWLCTLGLGLSLHRHPSPTEPDEPEPSSAAGVASVAA